MRAKQTKFRIKRSKVRTERGKGEYDLYNIRVPEEIAGALPADTVFTCELTEDGILYRPILETPRRPEPA